MLRVKLSVVCVSLLATVALLIGGCSSTPEDKTAGMSPNKLYAEAKDEMSSGQWERAILMLEKLEVRAAGDSFLYRAGPFAPAAADSSAEPHAVFGIAAAIGFWGAGADQTRGGGGGEGRHQRAREQCGHYGRPQVARCEGVAGGVAAQREGMEQGRFSAHHCGDGKAATGVCR